MTRIQGSIKEADYVAAQWLHIKPRPVLAVVGILLLVLAVGLLIYKLDWGLLIALSILLSGVFIWRPYSARRAFRQYKALAEPMSIEVRDDGLYFKREPGEGVLPWSYIRKWKRDSKLLLLYPANNLFYLIPSHLFESDVAFSDFVRLIETKAGRPD